MAFTKEETSLLKGLIHQELKTVNDQEHDFEAFMVNSPVFGQESTDDLAALGSAEKYKAVLHSILKKL